MQEIRETTPPDVNRQVELSVLIANRVYDLLEKKGMSQKDLAKKLGKTETEVSRWLSGTHNLTLSTIAKLSLALEDAIVITTSDINNQKDHYSFDADNQRCSSVADDSQITYR